MNLFLAALAAGLVLFLASLNWRRSIKTAIVITILEGGLRKWVLPQASEAIYFLKDGILLGAYAGYLLKERWPLQSITRRGAAMGWILAVAIIVLLEVINPALGSVLVGVIGAKSYLLYIPLVIVLPQLFANRVELLDFLRWQLLLAIPVCLLGVAQFFAPPDSPINVYAPSLVETSAALFGEDGNVRVTATFPYIMGFSVYLLFCLAIVAAVMVHHRSYKWMLTSGLEVLLIAISLFMTGSRYAMFSAAALAVGFVVFSVFEPSQKSRVLALALVLLGSAGVATSVKFFPTAVAAFTDRVESNDDIGDRVRGIFVEPSIAANLAGFGGYGAGSEQVAGFAVRDALNLGPAPKPAPLAEIEPTRVMLELGTLGFVAWYGLRCYFLWLLWRASRQLRDPLFRHLAFGAFLFHLVLLNGQLVTNTTVGVFYWFLAGFAFLLPKLDASSSRIPSRQIRSIRSQLPVSAVSV